MKLTYLQKQAAKEIIAHVLHELEHDEKIAAISWEELTQNTSPKAVELAETIRSTQPHRYGMKREMKPARSPENLMVIRKQTYHTASGSFDIPPRLIPRDTFRAFQAMNHAMKKDINQTLLIQSGYRSAAYQLFVFLFQLKENSWNFKKTLRSVDLPGYSEHATEDGQALDLRAEKFLGPAHAYDFSRTIHYRWLKDNAEDFGFSLSYPEDNESGIRFEPWHWFWKSTA